MKSFELKGLNGNFGRPKGYVERVEMEFWNLRGAKVKFLKDCQCKHYQPLTTPLPSSISTVGGSRGVDGGGPQS